MKVKELFEMWLEKYVKVSVKIRTYNQYKYVINRFIISVIGELFLSDVTNILLQDYICKLTNTVNNITNKLISSNTIYSVVRVLKSGFKLALELDLILKDPSTKLKLPAKTEKEVSALTREEQKRLENYCLSSSKSNYIGIVLCLYTGIRLGELLALTWDDINLKNKLLVINKTLYSAKVDGKYLTIIDTPKTKKSNRVIPLPDKLIKLLKNYKSRTISKYFISTRSKKTIDPRSYQRTFKLILKKCNIKPYNFHSLRHTFATRALELGMDMKTLSDLLGHSDISITLNRYAHSMFENKVKLMNKIATLL